MTAALCLLLAALSAWCLGQARRLRRLNVRLADGKFKLRRLQQKYWRAAESSQVARGRCRKLLARCRVLKSAPYGGRRA